jgi:hypothetical protein
MSIRTSPNFLFRLSGKDRVQSSAITEVAALSPGYHGRQDALSWLGNLKVIPEAKEIREPEEEDLMMQLSPLFLEKIQAAEQQGEMKAARACTASTNSTGGDDVTGSIQPGQGVAFRSIGGAWRSFVRF